MGKSLTVILPAYNEGLNIKNVVSEVIFRIREYIENFEVIVVNDGSSDTTSKFFLEMKSLYPELRVISHERNRGYGSAIKSGIYLSDGEYIFIMDSDGQFKIDDFELFWKRRQLYNFILGYRAVRKDNFYRRMLGRIGSFFEILFLMKKIKDINCGFKLFKLKDLKNPLLISTGGCFYFEILFRLLNSKNNKKFLQLPVRHYSRIYGKQTGGSPRVILKNFWEGIKIVLRR